MKPPGISSILMALLSLTACTLPAGGQTDVDVRGLGFFGNLEMERRLAFLSGVEKSEPPALGLVEVEDTAYIILQLLRRRGYAAPEVTAGLEFLDGNTESLTWTLPFVTREAEYIGGKELKSVTYVCDPGKIDYYRSVTVDGITLLDARTIRAFFFPSGILFAQRKDRAFTGENLDTRISRLLDALHREGYRKAELTAKSIERDPRAGAVDVHLKFDQGPVHRVGAVTIRTIGRAGPGESQITSAHKGEIFNTEWIRRKRQEILNTFYREFYPDTSLDMTLHPCCDEARDLVTVDLLFHARPGKLSTLKEVRYEPEDLILDSVFNRQAGLKAGEPFNLLEVEESRRRLLALGVFREVSMDQEKLDENNRRVTYILDPLPGKTLKLRLGWGSYELGRIGLNWEQRNMWGRAHRYAVNVKQSFKSTVVEGTYSIPHFFDHRIRGYARATHEFREEISYERTTSELVLGATRKFQRRDIDASVEFAVEKTDSTRDSENEFDSLDRATVSSLSFQVDMDRRDSVVFPTSGFDLSLYLKAATKLLGSGTDFRKFELNASYHKFLGGALYLHGSFRYGVISSGSPTPENLPFNERFFPGGENSVRGYKRGEAAPLSTEGDLIGAEAIALANIELEQRILSRFSVVIFWDGLSTSRDQTFLPREEFLHSAGIGIRWRTPVGPVRLEYGHNLDPRPDDPDGTLHFAVGFPF